jgi:hypothetical protein
MNEANQFYMSRFERHALNSVGAKLNLQIEKLQFLRDQEVLALQEVQKKERQQFVKLQLNDVNAPASGGTATGHASACNSGSETTSKQ